MRKIIGWILLAGSLVGWTFMPPIGTPSMVVAVDTFTTTTTYVSTSATPSDNAIIICFIMAIDNGTPVFGTPTDTWANTPTWTDVRESAEGFARMQGSWTTTGASPGAGTVTVVAAEESPDGAMALVEVTGIQLRNAEIDDALGVSSATELSFTVTGTMQPNQVMVYCVF